MATGKSQYLQPDPLVTSAAAADAFGSGGSDAEAMIEANSLRFSEALAAAQLLDRNEEATAELRGKSDAEEPWATYGDVADAADIDGKIESASAYGEPPRYVVFVYSDDNGRIGKDVLEVDEDGALSRPEVEETPALASARARVQAAQLVEDARAESAELLAKAQSDADALVAKAIAAVNEATENAVKEAQERADAQTPSDPPADGEGSTPAYGDQSPDDLKAQAEARNLTVEGTGANGNVLKADLVKALEADDAANSGD